MSSTRWTSTSSTESGKAGGELLVERLEDGHWGYRCDNVTRLYALAKYRHALILADHEDELDPSMRRYAQGLMCVAVQARKEVVLEVVKREVLSPGARKMLDRALADPECDVPNGWRTHYTGPYVPHYEGVAKPD